MDEKVSIPTVVVVVWDGEWTFVRVDVGSDMD